MNLRTEIIRILNEFSILGKKISQLPSADLPLDGSEYVEIVQGGVSKKVQVSDLPGGGPSPSGDSVLMETGDFILTELGDKILLE